MSTPKPEVSVVVVMHDMAREAPRTLYSLSAAYQRNISADDYEIIVVDNGSNPPLDPQVLSRLEGQFRLIRLDPGPLSPVHAINVGLEAARGDVIGVLIDGARLVTPGLLHFARSGVRMFPRSVVATLGWCLGLDQQRWALEGHYDRPREDAMLASISWPEDGYRLFEIGALDESSPDGWFGPLAETNSLFLSRETWDLLGGYDERFDLPGGGFANQDILGRALELPAAELVVLLGEATFHQLHGGIATNEPPNAIGSAVAQYEALRGRAWSPPAAPRKTYLGALPPGCLVHFARALVEPNGAPPLGEHFDRALWSTAPVPRPSDPAVAAVVALAENEMRAGRFSAAAAVSRMARGRAPDEPAPQRIASVAGPWLTGAGIPGLKQREAEVRLACGMAHWLFGDAAAAAADFHAALALEPDLVAAHTALSQLNLPGEDYLNWLGRFHAHLQPRTYLEIGVASGQSIALARPPTRAIGVDPQPAINAPFRTETHIFAETSDQFFARSDLSSIFGGQTVDFAFIDGLHQFQQALLDFANTERLCGPDSVILLHDTIPLDEITQRPDRQRRFYTGDTWKTVLCLRAYRPDLDIRTIPTSPSGLTMITSLDPSSSILHENYSAAVERFAKLQYEAEAPNFRNSLNIVPND